MYNAGSIPLLNEKRLKEIDIARKQLEAGKSRFQTKI